MIYLSIEVCVKFKQIYIEITHDINSLFSLESLSIGIKYVKLIYIYFWVFIDAS